MEQIMRIAAQVGTPLALAGVVCALFFYLLSKIITPTFVPKLNQKQGTRVVQLTIRSFFILSIVATCLGFMGWVIGKVAETSKPHVQQNAVVAPQGTNYGVIVGNLNTDHQTQAVIQVVQNYGVPADRYEALVRSGAVTEAALERFFRQINDTNDSEGDLATRLENAVHRAELKATQESNAVTVANMQAGIAALRRGDFVTAGKLLNLRASPPTALRIVGH